MDEDQAWFWTPQWQQMEREADEDIAAGRVTFFENAEAFEKYLERRVEMTKKETLTGMDMIFTDVLHAVLTISGPDWQGEIEDYNEQGIVMRGATMANEYADQVYPMPKDGRVFIAWHNIAAIYTIEEQRQQ